MVEQFGGEIWTDPGMAKAEYQQVVVEPDAPTGDKKRLVPASARESYLRVKMICSAHHSPFGELLYRLKNDYIKGNDNYPRKMTEAYIILNHYVRNTKQKN